MPIVEILVVLAFCILVGIQNIAIAITGAALMIWKGLCFAWKKAMRQPYQHESVSSAFRRIADKLKNQHDQDIASLQPALEALPTEAVGMIEAAKIYTRQYRGGKVRVHLFQYGEAIERSVWIRNRNRMSRRVLPPLVGVSSDEAFRLTKSEISPLVESKQVSRTNQPTVTTTTATPPETVSKQEPAIAVTVKPDPTPAQMGEKLDKALLWAGKVVDMGIFQRKQGKRTFDQYAIRLETEMGVVENVWGTDLARQVDEKSVTVGDQVQIRCLGKRPVPVTEPDGATVARTMNVYDIVRFQH